MSGITLNNLFGNINDPSVQKVMRSLDMISDVEVKAGEYVFKEGDKSTDFYIIGLGALEVVKTIDSEKGTEKVLDTLGSGDFFGEGAVFTEKPRSASVRALSECRLFRIDKMRFFDLLKNNNEIAVTFLSNMLTVVNNRLHHANRELVTLYEISRVISEPHQKFEDLLTKVLDQLLTIVPSKKALFVTIDPLTHTEKVSAERGFESLVSDFKSLINDFDALSNELKQEKTQFKISGSSLVLPIKNTSNQMTGMILLLESDSEYKDDDVRLCVSVSEQLSHVLDNQFSKLEQKDKAKIDRNYLSF